MPARPQGSNAANEPATPGRQAGPALVAGLDAAAGLDTADIPDPAALPDPAAWLDPSGGLDPSGELRQLTGDCVHCGFCLPACPTYQLWGEEMDSPRGRIHLMTQILDGAQADEAAAAHFDRCLGCMACVPACPSGVRYDRLIEAARTWSQEPPAGLRPVPARSLRDWAVRTMIFATFPYPDRLRVLIAPLRAAQRAGLDKLLAAQVPGGARPATSAPAGIDPAAGEHGQSVTAAATGGQEPGGRRSISGLLPAELVAALRVAPKRRSAARQGRPGGRRGALGGLRGGPDSRSRLRGRPAPPELMLASGPRRAVVGMLTGCVQQVFFPEVNAATARVLAAEGCDVVIPGRQGCCGALSMHAGRRAEAAEFGRRTIAEFERAGVDTVVVNAAGCGSAMKEYAGLLADDPGWAARAAAFSGRVRDLTEFLAELGPAAQRHPLSVSAAYHDACHLGHAQRITRQPRDLLAAIPGLQLTEIADGGTCCGSAGIYNLVQPEAAAELGARKAATVQAAGVQLLVSANPGCALQIAAALAAQGSTLPMAHIAQVLDASIQGAGTAALLD